MHGLKRGNVSTRGGSVGGRYCLINIILRFYHLEHVANRRRPAFHCVICSKLFTTFEKLAVQCALQLHCELTTGTHPYCLHIIYTHAEVPKSLTARRNKEKYSDKSIRFKLLRSN